MVVASSSGLKLMRLIAQEVKRKEQASWQALVCISLSSEGRIQFAKLPPGANGAGSVGCNHPSDTPYVGTAETGMTIASSATMAIRQSSDPNTHWCD